MSSSRLTNQRSFDEMLYVEPTFGFETSGIPYGLSFTRYLTEHPTEILRQFSPPLDVDS